VFSRTLLQVPNVVRPCPSNGIGGDRWRHIPGGELSFGDRDGVATFDEAECESAHPVVRGFVVSWVVFDKAAVFDLERFRQMIDLRAIERGYSAPKLEMVASASASRTESTRAKDGAGQRAVSSTFVTETEVVSDGFEFKLDHGTGTVTGIVELVGTVAHEDNSAGTENREPESFDVARAWVVSELVEEWVDPPAKDDGGRCLFHRSIGGRDGDRLG